MQNQVLPEQGKLEGPPLLQVQDARVTGQPEENQFMNTHVIHSKLTDLQNQTPSGPLSNALKALEIALRELDRLQNVKAEHFDVEEANEKLEEIAENAEEALIDIHRLFV